MIPIFIGYDPREAVAFHVCVNSIIRHASRPVSIQPLALNLFPDYQETHKDGSNQFIYSRFLVPYLMGFGGWAIYIDGDMVLQDDVYKLWNLREYDKDVMVVKHNYQTRQKFKYMGSKNQDYPRKNWSSVILWNCAAFPNRRLKPAFVQEQEGSYLHRFSWLQDQRIGELPLEWNWLPDELGENPNAKLLHYTLGTPCFREYQNTPQAQVWHDEKALTEYCEQTFELPTLQGDKPTGQHVIYVSCDTEYYDRMVEPLIRSIVEQIDWLHVHVHLICYDQLLDDIYNHERVTFSYEIITKDFIEGIKLNTSAPRMYRNTQILRTDDQYVMKEKIYFSCARFMRLADLFESDQYVLQIDADSILCDPFGQEEFEALTVTPRGMRKPKDPDTLIASCIGLGTGEAGEEFRQRFQAGLLKGFTKGAYWFMDQHQLKNVFSDIEFETIDILWCSWGAKRGMHFFTGKGDLKNQQIFLDRVEKWKK